MLFLPYLSCLNFDYSLFSLQTARCAMLTWEQSTRNEGKHPPLRACESLELPQLSLPLSSVSLIVWLRLEPSPLATVLTWHALMSSGFLLLHEQPLIVPHVFYPFLACCIVVVVQLAMVFCRGNMSSLSPLYRNCCVPSKCVCGPSLPLSSLVDPFQTIADAVLRVFCTGLRCWSKRVGGRRMWCLFIDNPPSLAAPFYTSVG